MSKITITINGANQEIEDNLTIQTILENLKTKSKMLVVELNTTIIPKEKYESQTLKEGDSLEIVSFFGGG